MRKKLDTRFPAARIKKIMQADEDVGKIALAVPVLVSKALELFLQDLCDMTYGITVQTGAKTVSSLHLKHCVQRYSIFDFLKEVVNKVPDHTHSGTSGEVQTISRRRKGAGDELSDSDEYSKRSRLQEAVPGVGGGRGRGRDRGRGRGRGRVGHVAEPDDTQNDFEPESSAVNLDAIQANNNNKGRELPSDFKEDGDGLTNPVVGKFDLNTEIKENESTLALATADKVSAHSVIQSENAELGLSEMDRINFNPLQLGSMESTFDDDEDYDEDG